MKVSTQLSKQFVLISQLLLCFIVVVVILIFSSWYLFVEIFPGALSVNPAAAFLFLLTSISFLILISFESTVWLKKIAYFFLVMVVLVSTYAFVDRFVHFSFHIDQVLFGEALVKKVPFRLPIDMAATSAVCFVLCTIALLLMKHPKKIFISQTMALIIFVIATYTIIGYLYKVPEIKSLFLMSVVSAILFYCLVLTILFCRPNEGMMKFVVASNTGGVAARILIPITIFLPILFGYLRVWSHWLNIMSVELGVASLVISITILYLFSVWRVTLILNKREEEKENYENALVKLNEDLKKTNQALDITNKDLQTSNEELLTSLEELTTSNEKLDFANQTIAKQRDERLNRVLDNINDVIWSFDLTGESDNYLSRSAARIFDEPYDKIVNEPYFWLKYIHPDDRPIKNESQKRLQRDGSAECTYRIVTPKGIRWVHDRLRILKDENGNQIRLEGVASDVTSIKETERELSRYRENLEIIFENTTDFFLLLDKEAKVIAFNRPFHAYAAVNLGIDMKVGDDYITVLPLNRHAPGMELYRRAMAGETIRVISEAVFKNDVKYYDVRYAPVTRNKEIVYVSISSTDITEQRKQEIISDKYKENLDIIFENSTDIFLLLDAKANIVLFNKAFSKYAEQLLKISPKIGMSFEDVVAPNRKEATKEIFARVLKGERVLVESESVFRDEVRFYEVNYNPVVNSKGEVTHITLSSTDITERKKSEVELKQNQYFLEKASEAAKIGYWTSTSDGIGKLTWSKGVFEIFEASEELFDGTNKFFFDRVHPDDLPSVGAAMAAAIKENKVYDIDHRIILKDGRIKWVNERAQVLVNMDDRQSALAVGVVQDIDQWKKMEEVLREYNDRFEILSRATNDVIWDWDIHQDFIFYNHGIKTVLGYSNKEIKPHKKWWQERFHPDDVARVNRELNSAFDSKSERWESYYRYRASDGSYKNIHDRASIVYHATTGKAIRVIGAMQDVTEQTRQTEEIASLFENANVPIIAFDREFKVVEWNPASAQALGYQEEEVINRYMLDDLLPPANVHRFKHMISVVLEGEAVSNFEMQVTAKDKSQMILLISASPRKMAKDQMQEAVVMAQNITELTEYRLRLEKIIEKRTQELNEALSKEKHAVEMQKRFVSMASHEFRTPLSSISLASGYIRKFKKKLSDEKIEEKLLGIETQIKHMTYLLDNVLMVGKSESGRIPVILSVLNTKLTFTTLTQEVMASTRNTHWIDLKFKCNKEYFVSDEGLLRNIVINLLNNAIKFSPQAETVDFSVSCDENEMTLIVKDHGVGIPPEDMNRLFEPFYRATNTKAISGTGLGLSIVKKAVELLNGKLTVSSQLGEGTQFTITFSHSNEASPS